MIVVDTELDRIWKNQSWLDLGYYPKVVNQETPSATVVEI
jgi:hypothetical protein